MLTESRLKFTSINFNPATPGVSEENLGLVGRLSWPFDGASEL